MLKHDLFTGVTSPQLIESVGMRQTDDDYCKRTSIEEEYCKNEGICYSTNEGPKCDCSFTDFDGRRCEQGYHLYLHLQTLYCNTKKYDGFQ